MDLDINILCIMYLLVLLLKVRVLKIFNENGGFKLENKVN